MSSPQQFRELEGDAVANQWAIERRERSCRQRQDRSLRTESLRFADRMPQVEPGPPANLKQRLVGVRASCQNPCQVELTVGVRVRTRHPESHAHAVVE